MTKSAFEEFVSTSEGMREYQRERAIYEVTELIERVMESTNVTRGRLAKRLGRTPSWVTQLLDGESNKTIRTVADTLAVLGHELRLSSVPIPIRGEKPIALRMAPGTWADEAEGWRGAIIASGTLAAPTLVAQEG